MKVGVIGTGHVGLVTCASLAAIGHDVVGNDADTAKVEMLSAGVMPFFEPGLEDLVAAAFDAGRLRFTSDPAEAIAGAEVNLICVGTPPRVTGEANLIAVEQCIGAVAAHATGPTVVVEKSTVPTGTASKIKRTLAHRRPKLAEVIEVVSNPEFLREGHAVQDALHPDRIIVGAASERGFEAMRRLYAPIIASGAALIEMDIASAELTKHASNAFLALKISFANALARICERSGADIQDVTLGMGMDPRIGPSFLRAGLGWGGSCFPKDLVAFKRLCEELGYDFPLLDEIARINEEAGDAAFQKVCEAVWNLDGKRVALLGLAFKPGTDDIRYSPALSLATRLLDAGAIVVGHDQLAGASAQSAIPALEIAPTPYAAADGADCLVLCSEYPEYAELDLVSLREGMSYPAMVDARNLLEPEAARAVGFDYYCMGRVQLIPVRM